MVFRALHGRAWVGASGHDTVGIEGSALFVWLVLDEMGSVDEMTERIREIGHPGRRYQADLTRMLPVAYAVVLFMVTIGAMALYADIFDPINLQ